MIRSGSQPTVAGRLTTRSPPPAPPTHPHTHTAQLLSNIFLPLFEVTQDPNSHPQLHLFLQGVSAVASSDAGALSPEAGVLSVDARVLSPEAGGSRKASPPAPYASGLCRPRGLTDRFMGLPAGLRV